MKMKKETIRSLLDIRYDTGESDMKSKTLRIIKQIFDAGRRKFMPEVSLRLTLTI